MQPVVSLRWGDRRSHDVAIRILDIEALCAPLSRRDRFDNCHAVGDALPVEGPDTVNARRAIEMIVVAPVLAVRVVLCALPSSEVPVRPEHRSRRILPTARRT